MRLLGEIYLTYSDVPAAPRCVASALLGAQRLCKVDVVDALQLFMAEKLLQRLCSRASQVGTDLQPTRIRWNDQALLGSGQLTPTGTSARRKTPPLKAKHLQKCVRTPKQP